jgi:hypothetical protein
MAPANSVLPMDNQFTHEDSVSTAIEETVEEILSHDLSSECYGYVQQAMSAGVYATTVLFGLEQYLRENEDEKGADMLAGFLRQFAKHEAETV